jgi:outer membrane protein OmpA-like peptidoglycan-associated protein/Tol biopolymer transport system component
MRILFIFFSLVLISSCSTAQTGYSTTNKKAIKLFEDGQQAPNKIDPATNRPDYRTGIELMDKAIEKDPKFWEAHMLAGEFSEIIGDYATAIGHYEAALSINPNHSPTGSTYFYLANLQQAMGDYDNAIKNIDIYVRNRNANPDLVRQAYAIRESCTFALESIRNPQKFNPINIGPGINTKDPEYFPTITVDGKMLLFTRRIDDDRTVYKQQEDFYVSLLEKNIWGKAVPMPININTTMNEGAPTISADGRSLIFVACSDDVTNKQEYGEGRTGKGSCDMFYTHKNGSRWLDPVNLPGSVNTGLWESQPSLSADGKTLYFIRRVSKKGEPVDSDIFVTRLLDNGQWSTAERLPRNINTYMEEESVLIHPDGKTLYFASRGHVGMGGSDIYMSTLNADGTWSNPENLGYPINTKYDENSLLVAADGEIAFFASDREGGYGDLDIYYFEMPEEFRPTKTLYFDGIVFDATDKKPIPGKFQLIDLKTGKEVIFSEADKITGEFLVSLPLNQEYALNVTYPGYNFFSKNFNMTAKDGLESIHMDVPMIPITSEGPTLLANVFFDLGKSTLRPESNIELNKLYEFLVKNPTLKIEIGGHTDTRGDDKANLTLSNDRAKAVYDYVVAKGIDPKRMTYKGYGETKTIVSDAEIAKLASEEAKEAAHQSNRRTEYKIIK